MPKDNQTETSIQSARDHLRTAACVEINKAAALKGCDAIIARAMQLREVIVDEDPQKLWEVGLCNIPWNNGFLGGVMDLRASLEDKLAGESNHAP